MNMKHPVWRSPFHTKKYFDFPFIDDSDCDFCLCHADGERHHSKFAKTQTISQYNDGNPVPFFDRGNSFLYAYSFVPHFACLVMFNCATALH